MFYYSFHSCLGFETTEFVHTYIYLNHVMNKLIYFILLMEHAINVEIEYKINLLICIDYYLLLAYVDLN